MKLLVLGGSRAQVQCIHRAKEMGHEVIVCDYLGDSIGHQIADKSYLASTFDISAVMKVAEEEKVHGIMTMGTDQPVYTGAYVSHRLDLPTLLSEETALGVTNKIHMKNKLKKSGIPSVKGVLLKKSDVEDFHETGDWTGLGLELPIVMKPVDSQGQRGIFYMESFEDILKHVDESLSFSRQEEVLIEEYYEHDEVTFSGWVHGGRLYPLILSDRVTFEHKDQIGICLSHEWPSKYLNDYGQAIVAMSRNIVRSLEIEEGPVYFQFLIGNEGIKVNEIAARIGGAYEGYFIPVVTGFDVVEAQIRAQLGQAYDLDPVKDYNMFQVEKHISVQLFFVQPGQIESMPTETEVLELPGVIQAGFNVRAGDQIGSIENATARGGYILLEDESRQELEDRIEGLYDGFKIFDGQGTNMVIHTDYERYMSRRY